VRKLIYSMGVTLDGFIAGPGGEVDWSAPARSSIGFTTSRHGSWARTSSGGGCTRRCFPGETAGAIEEVTRLKQQPGKDVAVGGAGLASTFVKLGLIDEYRLFVSPVVLGAGTPYFPALEKRIDLELVETRTFGSRVVYVRYQRA
jgi:hypothetical protein